MSTNINVIQNKSKNVTKTVTRNNKRVKNWRYIQIGYSNAYCVFTLNKLKYYNFHIIM